MGGRHNDLEIPVIRNFMIGCVVLFAGCALLWLWSGGRERSETQRKAGQVEMVIDANTQAADVIASLQLSVAECETKLLMQHTQASQALARQAERYAEIAGRYDALQAKVAASHAGPCKGWAESPVCGDAR